MTRKHTGRSGVAARRATMKIAAATVVGGLAISACGTNQLGAAAISGDGRVSAGTLTSEVANLSAQYEANEAKGIKPQRPTDQEAQQVLTWLLLFRIYDKIAAQQRIYVTPAQSQRELAALNSQASQAKVSLAAYVSAAGALPPDLLPQLGRYFAILSTLERRFNGGAPPASATDQAKVAAQVSHAQCVAAKSLSVQVNPQFGVFDYHTYAVVLTAPKLAANPVPSPTASRPLLSPPC